MVYGKPELREELEDLYDSGFFEMMFSSRHSGADPESRQTASKASGNDELK
jgi:hypothetical protein